MSERLSHWTRARLPVVELKYLVVVDVKYDKEDFLLFPMSLEHVYVAERFGRGEVAAAGFVTFYSDGKARCFGQSMSTGLASRPDRDSILLNVYLAGSNKGLSSAARPKDTGGSQ